MIVQEKNIFEIVKNVIHESTAIEISSICMESNLRKDLGLDSLDSLELLMSLEEEFSDHNLVFSESMIAEAYKVEDMVRIIEKQL